MRLLVRRALVLFCFAVPVQAQDSDRESPIILDQELAVSGDSAELIDTLFLEYDPQITTQKRATAQTYVVGRDEGITPGKAWNDYAVGRHLVGEASVAIWAGLNAVRTEWRAEFVANCGTFLVEAGRFRAGLALLRRAYAMGYRSAYLHEAMAAAHEGLGEYDAAKSEIETAARLDPTDAAIRVQKSLLETGKPPAAPADRNTDDLDTAFGELEEHIRYVTRETRNLASALDRWEKAAGFPPDQSRAKWFDRHIITSGEAHLSAVRQAIERARSRQPPFSEHPLVWRNAALLTMVIAYVDMTNAYLASPDKLNADWSFWASVAWRGKEQYIHSLHGNLKYNFRYEEPDDSPMKTNDPAALIADNHGTDLAYTLLMYPRMAAFLEAICDLGVHCPFNRPDEGVSCGSWAGELSGIEATVELRLRNAAPRFDNALAGVLSWHRLVVLDARRYANTWLGKLTKRKDQSTVPEYMRNNEKFMIDGIKMSYSELMPYQLQFFINRQIFRFDLGRTKLLEFLDAERRQVETCQPPRSRQLADFSKEELEAMLQELNELMKEDIEAKSEFNPECTVKIDGLGGTIDAKNGVTLQGFGVNANQSGDVSLNLGPVEVGTKGATGVTVEVGHSLSGGEVVVAKVGIKIIGELDTATGKWDAVAEVGGKLGLGVAVPEIGEGACYPGSGKVTLQARSFVRKEIMYQRVSEELARR